ncbi:MAG: hypothetical protein ACREJB_18860 [Planctomycetaceae bacterium]
MTKTFSVLAVGVMGLLAAAGEARADHEHIDELANVLRIQAGRVEREIRYHFRSTRQYPHLHNGVTEMQALAEHVHELAHHGDELGHLRADVDEWDALFHHVEELVDQVRVSGGHYHHGHYHGVGPYHMRRLGLLMQQMEATLHHLQEEVNVPAPAGPRPSEAAPAPLPRELTPPTPVPPSEVSPMGDRPVFRSRGGRFSISFP